jgi:hypothetical protein
MKRNTSYTNKVGDNAEIVTNESGPSIKLRILYRNVAKTDQELNQNKLFKDLTS